MGILVERREIERVKCEKRILHNTSPADFFYTGKMLNFSKHGLYFESNEDLLPGHEITVLIKGSRRRFNKSHQKLNVKIIWCRELKDSLFQLGYGAKLISTISQQNRHLSYI